MCDIDVLRKLTCDDDSPWAAPSFAQIKKTGDVFKDINGLSKNEFSN
jgi:hypothetical protein